MPKTVKVADGGQFQFMGGGELPSPLGPISLNIGQRVNPNSVLMALGIHDSVENTSHLPPSGGKIFDK